MFTQSFRYTVRCLFQDSEHCNCVGGSEKLKILSDARLTTIEEKSKKRKDDLHKQFKSLPATTVLKAHEACTSRYTSEYHIQKYLNRKRREKLENEPVLPKKPRRSSGASAFIWKLHCLFCGKPCALEKDPKNPNRWREAYLCTTSDRGPNKMNFKDFLLKVRIFKFFTKFNLVASQSL